MMSQVVGWSGKRFVFTSTLFNIGNTNEFLVKAAAARHISVCSRTCCAVSQAGLGLWNYDKFKPLVPGSVKKIKKSVSCRVRRRAPARTHAQCGVRWI